MVRCILYFPFQLLRHETPPERIMEIIKIVNYIILLTQNPTANIQCIYNTANINLSKHKTVHIYVHTYISLYVCIPASLHTYARKSVRHTPASLYVRTQNKPVRMNTRKSVHTYAHKFM